MKKLSLMLLILTLIFSITVIPAEAAGTADVKKASDYAKKAEELKNNRKHQEALRYYDLAAKANPNDPNYPYRKGILLETMGDSEGAIEAYKQAVKVAPGLYIAFNSEGKVYYLQRAYIDAIKSFDKAINQGKKNLLLYESYCYKGEALAASEELDKAIAAYDMAIKLNGKFVYSYIGKGHVLWYQKNYAEAIKLYDRGIEANPNIDLYEQKAATLILSGKIDEAIKSLDPYIKNNPKDYKGYDIKGTVLYLLEKYNEAIVLYDKAISFDQRNDVLYANKANALYALEKYDDALKLYDEALAINPYFIDALYSKGEVLAATGKYADATAVYDKVIKMDPDYYWAYCSKGAILGKQGKFKEAIDYYDKAIKINSTHYPAYIWKGDLLISLGEIDKAIENYDIVLLNLNKKSDYLPHALVSKGFALYLNGEVTEAIGYFEEALKLDADNEEAYNRKGEALSNLGLFDEAAECFRRSLEIQPGNKLALLGQANMLLYKESYEDAITAFNEVIVKYPDLSSCYNNKGYALYKLGRYEEAIASFKKVNDEIDRLNADAFYYMAKALVKLNRYDEAIDSLKQSITLFPRERDYIRDDPDFDAIKDMDAFKALLPVS